MTFNNEYKEISDKTLVIPNGINGYWLQNVYFEKRTLNLSASIIYAGDICKNKNS